MFGRFQGQFQTDAEPGRAVGIRRSLERQVWQPDTDLGEPHPSGTGTADWADDVGPGVSQWVVPNNFVSHYGQPPDGTLIRRQQYAGKEARAVEQFRPAYRFCLSSCQQAGAARRGGHFLRSGGRGPYHLCRRTGQPVFGHGGLRRSQYADPGESVPVHSGAGNVSSRWANFQTGQTSSLNVPFLDEVLHTPMVRQ